MLARHNGHEMVEPFPDNPAWAEDMPELGRTEAGRNRVADYEQPTVWKQPTYREIADKCWGIKNAGWAHFGGRLLNPKCTIQDVLVDYWTVLYAEGSYLCNGVSITDRAFEIGVEKATLSTAIINFTLGQGLPASEYLKDPETMQAYRQARLKSVNGSRK